MSKDDKLTFAIVAVFTAIVIGWASYSFGSNRAWHAAEYESLRVYVAGYCRGTGDGVVYMTAEAVPRLTTNDIYGEVHADVNGQSTSPGPYVEEYLNEGGLSEYQLDEALREAVANQLPVVLYNWDLQDIPSLEGSRYSLDRLDRESADQAHADWCEGIAVDPHGPPEHFGDFLKDVGS